MDATTNLVAGLASQLDRLYLAWLRADRAVRECRDTAKLAGLLQRCRDAKAEYESLCSRQVWRATAYGMGVSAN